MGLPVESLVRWLKRQLSDTTEEGSISHFELTYSGSGDSLFRLEQFIATDDDGNPVDGEELSVHVWGVAEEDAKTRGGHIHRYSVLAFRADEEQHESITSFTIHGRMLASDFVPSEPGTESGVTSQLMRHNEQLMVMTARVIESTMGKLTADLEAERAKRLALEGDRERVLQLKESLLDNQEERDARRREDDARAERTNQMLNMFLQSAPLLLGAAATALSKFGKKTGEASDAQAQLAEMITGLDTEKLAQLAALVAPEKQSELVALLGQLNSKADKKEP